MFFVVYEVDYFAQYRLNVRRQNINENALITS